MKPIELASELRRQPKAKCEWNAMCWNKIRHSLSNALLSSVWNRERDERGEESDNAMNQFKPSIYCIEWKFSQKIYGVKMRKNGAIQQQQQQQSNWCHVSESSEIFMTAIYIRVFEKFMKIQHRKHNNGRATKMNNAKSPIQNSFPI